MNVNSDKPVVPKWLWAALSAGILMLIGSTWWAVSDEQPPKPRVTVQPYREPTGAGPASTSQQQGTLTVSGEPSTPLMGGHPGVTVTPLAPAPLINPGIQPMNRPAIKRKPAARPASSVADMFPVGPIFPRPVIRVQPVVRVDRVDPTPKQEETFPGFTYGGSKWNFTGAFANAAELEVAPTGLELGGRNVFGLANATGPAAVLFVQSKVDASKFAIYR